MPPSRYEYPRVPRSSNSTLSVDTGAGNRSTTRDSAFSWIATPAEIDVRLERGLSDAPPLPQIPADLTATQQHPQPLHPTPDVPAYTSQDQLVNRQENESGGETDEEMARYTSHQQPGRGGIPTHTPVPIPTQHEVQQVTYAATTTNPHEQYQQHHYYSHHQPPTPPASDPPKTSSLPTTPQRAHFPVEPDANPLRTPHTPSSPFHPPPHTPTTTNIPILSPPGHATSHPHPNSHSHTHSQSNYTPHAQPRSGGPFTHSLFSCSPPSICLPALFCPCVIYGRTQYRLSQRSAKSDPTNLLGYNTVNGSCVAFAVLCGVNGILAAIQHTRVRKAYRLDRNAGSVLGDCIRGCCCCCCVVAQDEKEVKGREEEVRKAGGGKEGYVAVGGMVYGGDGAGRGERREQWR